MMPHRAQGRCGLGVPFSLHSAHSRGNLELSLHAHRACFVRTDRHAVREERSAALGRSWRVSMVPVMHASHTELCIGLAFSWGKIPVGAPAAFPTGFLLSKAVRCTLRKARADRQLERCVSVLVFTFSLKC